MSDRVVVRVGKDLGATHWAYLRRDRPTPARLLSAAGGNADRPARRMRNAAEARARGRFRRMLKARLGPLGGRELLSMGQQQRHCDGRVKRDSPAHALPSETCSA